MKKLMVFAFLLLIKQPLYAIDNACSTQFCECHWNSQADICGSLANNERDCNNGSGLLACQTWCIGQNQSSC